MKLGRRDPEPTPKPQDARRERRVAAARACRAWTEFDRAELGERGYLVHVETDAAYLPYRGDAFIIERQPRSWSQLVYQRARAGAR